MSQCQKCGCQIESPFDGKTVIHDEEKCGSVIQPPAPKPFALEWDINVKADSLQGAMDAVWKCWQAWQRGSEPISGNCNEGMGPRMCYEVKAKHDFKQVIERRGK